MKKLNLTFLFLIITIFFASCNESEEEKLVISKINEIGSVTLESEQSIIEAEKIFNSLKKAEQVRIKNKEKLFEARSEYNSLVANDIDNQISKLGNIMTDDAKKIFRKYVLLPIEIRRSVKNFNIIKRIFETTPGVKIFIIEYDENENRIYSKNARNDETWYKYNELNLCTEYTTKTNEGKLTIGYTTYDENNRPVKYYNSDSWGYTCEYDKNGNEIHRLYTNGDEKWYEYDDNNNMIYSRELNPEYLRKLCGMYYEEWRKYDSHQNCIWIKNTMTEGESNYVFDYDDKNLLIHKNFVGFDIYYFYDENDNLTYSKEYFETSKQLYKENFYNANGLVIKSIGNNLEEITEYDSNGNKLYNSYHSSNSDSESWIVIDYWDNGKKKSEIRFDIKHKSY